MDIDWNRSIAYLKRKLPDKMTADLSLSHEYSPVLRDLGNGLLVAYLVDVGKRFTYVQARHLLEAKIDSERLHQVGIDNLYALAQQHLRVQQVGPIFAVFMEGNFEASVLLLEAVWETSFAGYVQEDFVAAIPARDVLAFGDSSSVDAVNELRAVVDRVTIAPGDHNLSTSLYRRRRLSWVSWDA